MGNKQEFEKIKNAFIKVKEDMNYLNNSIEQVKAQKADRVTTQQMMSELNKLRQVIIEMSMRQNNVSNQSSEKLGVIGNLDSKKVHYSNCPFAKRIIHEHRITFHSIPDALNHNYNKCSCVL